MEALTFFSAMNRGQFREEQGIGGSSYCIFFAPMVCKTSSILFSSVPSNNCLTFKFSLAERFS